MTKIIAKVFGAVSIVNAIALRKGSTLGIDTFVEATLTKKEGTGIHITSENKTISSRLINKVIENMIPKKKLEKTKLELNFRSNIPTGYGLKSSSAISTAVVMAVAKAFDYNMTDEEILKLGSKSSIEARVSITGAYDDACACYFGGFNVTDNSKMKLFHREYAPENLQAIIFLPNSRKRGNLNKLKKFKPEFVLISAGFDSHANDPLAQFKLETEDFYTITERILKTSKNFCNGKVVSILEGGYDLEALRDSTKRHVDALIEYI